MRDANRSLTGSAAYRDRPALGIATFSGNLLVMALLGAAVREPVERAYPLAEVLLFRYLFASLLFWIILFSTAGLAALATRRPPDHAVRRVSGIFIFARRQRRRQTTEAVVIE